MLSQKLLPLFFLLVSACSYHLRGDIQLAKGAEKVYLAGASGTLRQEVNQIIHFASAGELVESMAEAAITIKITKEDLKSRVLSMNPAGQYNQLQLVYQIDFSIHDAKGKLILDDQKINVKTEYLNDQTAILGKMNEESIIRAEMYKQAASSLVGRINMALEANNKAVAK